MGLSVWGILRQIAHDLFIGVPPEGDSRHQTSPDQNPIISHTVNLSTSFSLSKRREDKEELWSCHFKLVVFEQNSWSDYVAIARDHIVKNGSNL